MEFGLDIVVLSRVAIIWNRGYGVDKCRWRQFKGFTDLHIVAFMLGLLTVDPKKRLTLEDVKHSHWLFPDAVPQTPLMTPDVLNGSRGVLGFRINMTMNAFNKAAKAGFKLNSVSNAPLAQRRKNKKCSTTSHSDSCDSR